MMVTPLLTLVLLTIPLLGAPHTPQEIIDTLTTLHQVYTERTTQDLSSDDIAELIDTLNAAHELAHDRSRQDQSAIAHMVADITDWLVAGSESMDDNLAIAVRGCCSRKCIQCLIVDNLIVRNKAYLPSGSGSCAPCSSLDVPNTLALRDSTGSFALNNISIDGNAIFTKSTNQSPSGQIIMEGTPVFWVYPNGGNLSTLIGGAGNTSGAIYQQDIAIGQGALASASYAGVANNGNIAIGPNALAAGTTGERNIAIGKSAMAATQTGSDNTVIGFNAYAAAINIIPFSRNTVIGSQALSAATEPGSDSVAIGYNALRVNVAGRNVACGSQALAQNTSGVQLVAMGYNALNALTQGSDNVAIGYEAAAVLNNTSNSSNNVFIGATCAVSLTAGSNNSLVGYNCAQNMTGGNDNSFLGYFAGSNVNSDGNTAVGANALQGNALTGGQNTVIGYQAAQDLGSTSSQNVFVGAFSGSAANVSNPGGQNTVIGYAALPNSHGGNSNIIIGANAGSGYLSSESNNILIGDPGQTGDGSTNPAVCRIGNIYGITPLQGTTQQVIIDTNNQLGAPVSSRRFKTNIHDLSYDAAMIIQQLRPVEFNYKNKDGQPMDNTSFGLIAEEVADAIPALVNYDADGLPHSVRYHEMDAFYIAALQYVIAQNIALQARLDALEARIS